MNPSFATKVDPATGLPYLAVKKRGRPSGEKRIPSTGEEQQRKRPAAAAAAAASSSSSSAQPEKKKKPQVCGKCKQPGHNKASCGKQ